MARGSQNKNDNVEIQNVKQYKGIARQCIKYAGEFIKAGCKFNVDEKDVEELKQYAEIEEVEITLDNNGVEDGEKEGE